MYNKIILIGTVIQNVLSDDGGKSYITLETHSENGRRTQHTISAVKKISEISQKIAMPAAFVKVEGMLVYNQDGRAVILAHNIAEMIPDPQDVGALDEG